MFHVKHNIEHTQLTPLELTRVEEFFNRHQQAFFSYAELLLWWNKKVNLVSRDVSHETLVEHIRHSLFPALLDVVHGANRIVDAGTGGGLPAIPLAICFPEKEIIANDIVGKKIVAVKKMANDLGLKNIKPEHGSISNLNIEPNHLIVTKHAFKVDELIDLVKESEWNSIVFLKGYEEASEEISRVKTPIKAQIIKIENKLNKEFYKGKGMVAVKKQ